METLVVIITLLIAIGRTERSENGLSSLTNEGKIQYDIVHREAQMPSYGDCYQNALHELHKGCEELTDEIQSRLALSLTNCYLIRFGWTVYECGNDQKLEECMLPMDARAASIYSSMLTNTLAMCHFLKGQAWYQATNNAIHSLTSTSEAVSLQLSQAVDAAAALREQLDSQLLESREALRSAFSEIRESTAEQRSLIVDVFDRIAQLQALVMGEFTWFSSVVFYISCVLVSLVATCTPRTLSARLPLLVVFASSFLVERALTSFLLANPCSWTLQEDVHTVVWKVRHISIVLCFCFVFRAALFYRDPIMLTAARLEELAGLTVEIKKLINSSERGIEMSTTALASLSQVFDDSASSDDSYSPSEESATEECTPFSTLFISNSTSTKSYFLRKRPATPVPQNPIVAVESPEAFERIVKRRESLTRRRSQSQLRQYSILDQTCPQSKSEEMWHIDSDTNVSL